MKSGKNVSRIALGGIGAAVALGMTLATAQAAPHIGVTAAKATATVLKRFPGKLTQKTVLENEEGSWQYSVMVRSGRVLREVMVDAKSGKIANVETTSDSKERVEQHAEAAAAHAHHGHAVKK